MSVPEMAVESARARLRDAETRFSVGMSDRVDVEVSRVRLLEVEGALESLRKKIEIRQKFLKGEMDAVETELRVLECEAEQRRKIAAPKVELARKEAERAQSRFETGTAQHVEVAEATLRRLELETELTKADLDLALVRRQIEQHRAGR
jgi:outer membrane protein TolC